MSREIRFRAWDKIRNIMVGVSQIDFHSCDGSRPYRVHVWTAPDATLFIERCVLMQFTGLKDKTGKEIFEGDIIEYKDSLNGRARYKVHHELKQMNSSGMFNCIIRECGFTIPENCEVIGNAFENPELLNG